jgi:hypothetical protein
MSAKKYIVFNCDGIETPVVFPEHVIHKEVALKTEFENCKPISAALFDWNRGEVVLEGESRSLGLRSRPQDAELIKKLLTTGY